ncbi:hypothetical protein HK103_000845 [Boothiomyces macroporosus]|uniref:Uncharacterized protein n=1 Tax=Boothiomyces macroporosus TaxID=261099 RepID=A0AAD5UB09_9FUNG|nr:hypothetical protein HK103_000845 [Boothiomyces macroporosus]
MSLLLENTTNSCVGVMQGGTVGLVDCDPTDYKQRPYPVMPQPRTPTSNDTLPTLPTDVPIPTLFPDTPQSSYSSSNDRTGYYVALPILIVISICIRIFCCVQRAQRRKEIQTQIDTQLAEGKKLDEVVIDGVPVVQPTENNYLDIPTVNLDQSSALPVTESGTALPVTESGTALPVTESGTALPVTESGTALPVAESGTALPVTGSGNSLPVTESGITNTAQPIDLE